LTGRYQKRSPLRADVLSTFGVAIVEPEFALNVGYMARTMANFGLDQLFIVSAKKNGIEKSEALKFSSHGHYVVENAKYVKGLDQLRKKFQILIGTTAIRGKRKSNITRKTFALEDSIPNILRSYRDTLRYRGAGLSQKNQGGLCFVFGRDTTGLTNEELRKCDYNITITTGTKYNTLNISHAAAIIFYSFRNYLRHHQSYSSQKSVREREPSRKEKERVVTLFQELASLSDFQTFKKQRLQEALSRILNRSSPSLREIYLLMGLASKAQTKIKNLSSYKR
jgi:tRNA/rRNA methyltransferase